MENFFHLHHRQDIVLYRQGDRTGLGVILRVVEPSYIVLPLGLFHATTAQVLQISESQILQKVGDMDFEAIHDNLPDFGLEDWLS